MDTFTSRDQIAEKYRWNLELIYESPLVWESDFKKIDGLTDGVQQYRGKLSVSESKLLAAFEAQSELDLLIEKLYVYAHLYADQDTRNTDHQGRQDRIRSKATEVSAKLSWIEPELLAGDAEALKAAAKSPVLKDYSRRLEHLILSKSHQRSAEVEEVLSLAGEPLGVGYKTFSLLENADMQMPKVLNSKGESVEVNHATYGSFMESDDRVLRKNAYIGFLNAFGGYKNTLASTLDGHVKKQIFYSKCRKFPSAIEASLFQDQIPLSVYNNLISAAHDATPLLQELFALRKRVLKIDDYSMYDNLVPMVKPAQTEISYDQACEWVIDSARPMGDEYVDTLKRAFSERWVDVYYSTGKRSGAYSSGMYLTKPYILLNHKNNLNSAFTLAHELGHSLHTFFSNRSQPYAKAGYPIFLAEVASTTNEMLLFYWLMERADSREMKLYLMDYYFTQFRSTFFRQTQFAEFERDIHAMAEAGEPLTADSLSSHYYALNAKYYGDVVIAPEATRYEWSRIPHFYYNFYVYKYATSFAASQYIARQIFEGNTEIRDRFLEFLRSGGSSEPLVTLARAGVDLSTPQPITDALKGMEAMLPLFQP